MSFSGSAGHLHFERTMLIVSRLIVVTLKNEPVRDPKSIFGEAVREKRLSLGRSQERLAEEADLHWTYLGGIERGERNVSLMNIVRVANALKCSTDSDERVSQVNSPRGTARKSPWRAVEHQVIDCGVPLHLHGGVRGSTHDRRLRPKRGMGRTDVPDLSADYERAYGWKGEPSTRAKWRSGSSARRSVVENGLTAPTLSEKRFCKQLRRR